MKKLWISLVFFWVTSVLGVEKAGVPQRVEIDGRFDFDYVDDNDNLFLSRFMQSASELKSASRCSFQIIAEDKNYNSYPGTFELIKIEQGVVTAFLIKSRYIDESGRYRHIPITSASFEVVNQTVDDSSWGRDSARGHYILLDSGDKNGLELFHQLTMGQPMTVHLQKAKQPKEIVINVAPIAAKTSAIARRCMKLIYGDL